MKKELIEIKKPKFLASMKELSAREQDFIALVRCLDNQQGCFAGNEFFMDFFGISDSAVTKNITSLEKDGYLERKLVREKGFHIKRRVLKLSFSMKMKFKQHEKEMEKYRKD